MATQKTFLFVLIVIVPLFLTTFSKTLPDHLRSSIFTLSKPFLAAGESLRDWCSSGVMGVKKVVFLYRENAQLKKEAELLESEILRLREQEKENARLRILLDFKSKAGVTSIACRVIGRESSHLSHWALLDKGSNDGLKQDMPVATDRGLVGKVVEVGPGTARVILLTDVESTMSGLLQDSRATGLVTGDGSPFLKMKFIELDSDIHVGEIVLSSGLGGVYPKGLPVGKVEYVGRERNGLYQYAKLKPAVSFSKVEEVLCLDYPGASS